MSGGRRKAFLLCRRSESGVHRPPASLGKRASRDDWDALDDADRAALHSALDKADEELKSGKGIPGAQVIAELRRGVL